MSSFRMEMHRFAIGLQEAEAPVQLVHEGHQVQRHGFGGLAKDSLSRFRSSWDHVNSKLHCSREQLSALLSALLPRPFSLPS